MSWSKELDYHATYHKLKSCIKSKAEENHWYRFPKRKAMVAILLIALRNGTRASESLEAFNLAITDKSRLVKVRVRKRGFEYQKDENGRKHRSRQSKEPENPVYREVVIPDEISLELPLVKCKSFTITEFCVRRFGHGVHALRYCFITAMSKKGIQPQLIAKITGQATVNEIVRYTEQVSANNILREGV